MLHKFKLENTTNSHCINNIVTPYFFMKHFIPIVIISSFLNCSSPAPYDVVLTEIGLFDGHKDHGVVNIGIRGDTISIITNEVITGDSIYDGNGKYLLPGLVNSHSHVWAEEHLQEGHNLGILAKIGLHASLVERDQKLKKLSREIGYPYYFTSGFAATVPGGHPTQVSENVIETINDSVSVETWVENRITEGVDLIKIVRHERSFRQASTIPTLPYDSVKKIIDYARARNLKTIVHIGTREEMIEVAKLKPDGFAHMWQYAEQTPVTADMIDVIKKSGAFVVPTSIMGERGRELAKERGSHPEGFPLRTTRVEGLKNLILLHDAGVMIVAGTDSGNLNLNWGDDLLNELRIYTEAGLSNLEALQTATGNAATAWDIPIGKLDVGSRLNMIIVNGNPIEDLQNLRQVQKVIKNGAS